MTSKQGYDPDFSKYINKKVLIRLEDDLQIIGTIESVDHFMNMVLDNAFQVKPNEDISIPLNKTIIRGKTINTWEFLDKDNQIQQILITTQR